MGGGLIQLIAIGEQDQFLTGNPQITFFKSVYRHYTNFSMELIEQSITNSISKSDFKANFKCIYIYTLLKLQETICLDFYVYK